MRLSALLLALSRFLVFPSIIFTVALYLYPAILGCNFPLPRKHEATCFLNTNQSSPSPISIVPRAPFRLLVLADPQLEGDSSLPNPDDPTFPSIIALGEQWHRAALTDFLHSIPTFLHDFFARDISQILWVLRKRLDLFGNDYYLGHIYRTMHWWTDPTHVTVLGDLLGSQWISDEEFSRRSWRFWNRVFKHGHMVADAMIEGNGRGEPLGADDEWKTRIINVVGNHDIGYAGDINEERLSRFEDAFGRVNYDLTFRLNVSTTGGESKLAFGGPPELRIVILNSMNLDGPVWDEKYQGETYDFVNTKVIQRMRPVEDRKAATVILTHIPLHKEAGVCVDGPFFDYSPTGIREQNHLSEGASKIILEGILGMSNHPDAPAGGRGRRGIILNGHDHEGCDTYHYMPQEDRALGGDWKVTNWGRAPSLVGNDVPGVREITMRSMMGSFGGHSGMLSAWFDEQLQEWQFAFSSCMVGVQHLWWGVHVLDLITVLLFVGGFLSYLVEEVQTATATSKPMLQKRNEPRSASKR